MRRSIAAVRLAGECPDCGEQIVVRHRRSDASRFLSCSGYPSCRWAGDYNEHLVELDTQLDDLLVDLEAQVDDLRARLDEFRKAMAPRRTVPAPGAVAATMAVTAASQEVARVRVVRDPDTRGGDPDQRTGEVNR